MKYLNKYNTARSLIYLIAIASILSYISIITDDDLLKYISAITQISALILSLRIILLLRKIINWETIIPILLVLAVYPLYRIILDVITASNSKALTDGLIIYWGYYQLVLIGFALALLTKEGIGHSLLKSYAYFALPVGIVLLITTFSSPVEYTVGLGRIGITNCFVPLALLAFHPGKRTNLILGLSGVFGIFLMSVGILSRSFFIIGLLLLFFSLVSAFRIRKVLVAIVVVSLFVAYSFDMFSFLSQASLIRETSTLEKFEIRSLEESIIKSIQTGEFEYLYYWQGNSRAEILLDAFGDFGTKDWIFGSGIFATYSSFVERSTIEIGWAQEVFRFGFFYLIPVFLFIIVGYIRLKRNKSYNTDPVFRILGYLLLIRLLDGFLYGVPEASVYNLFFFWGLTMQGITKTKK